MAAKTDDNGIFLGKAGTSDVHILPEMMNRHGLIAGATGTGKTVSLRIMAEQLSYLGVPSFVADVKGDLAGVSQPGESHPKIEERAELLGLKDFAYKPAPVVFWDLYAEKGHPFRATISDMGPLLLSRLMKLSATQESVLYIAFKVADDQGLLLLDLKDLRALLAWLDGHRKEVGAEYGRVTSASITAIQRELLVLEQQGADMFFGEPMLKLEDIMRTDKDGRGIINVLSAEKLINSQKLYATSLLWLLSELFEGLPEVGDVDQPVLAFFFDEAHLLFDDAPDALVDKVEQVVKLIRSKGVGVYFATQNPLDIPDPVLAQLGNRVQHALRAYTPRERKAVKTAAETFRTNPDIDTETAITELGVGEALVSTLDRKGRPTMVQQTLIRPPETRLDPITDMERFKIKRASPVGKIYDKPVDRESAFEILKKRTEQEASQDDEADNVREKETRSDSVFDSIFGSGGKRRGGRQSVAETFAKSVARSAGTQIGRKVMRGILGSIFK